MNDEDDDDDDDDDDNDECLLMLSGFEVLFGSITIGSIQSSFTSF